MGNFFNGNDADMLTGSQNFSDKISATPGAFGLVAAQATSYAALNSAYATAYGVAIDPETRTKAAVSAKNQAKANLKLMASDLAKIIDGTSTVTDAQKIELGLNVRATPTPIGPPTDAPIMEIKDRMGTIVTIKLHDGTGSRRGRPPGVQGASVFSYIGPTPPIDVTDWVFQGNTTKTVVDVEFPAATAPGTTVFLTAFWYSPRGQSGPGCSPVAAIIAGGAMQQAA